MKHSSKVIIAITLMVVVGSIYSYGRKSEGEVIELTAEYTVESNTETEVKVNEELIIPTPTPMTVVMEGKTVASRGGNIEQPHYSEFILTFYSDLPEENGGYTTTCEGKKLVYGMVANNTLELGTKIYIKEYDMIFTVSDKGGKHFNSSNRLDVFIPRKQGESKTQYKKRLLELGKQKVTGYIIK